MSTLLLAIIVAAQLHAAPAQHYFGGAHAGMLVSRFHVQRVLPPPPPLPPGYFHCTAYYIGTDGYVVRTCVSTPIVVNPFGR